MNKEDLVKTVECLLFVSAKSLSVQRLASVISGVSEDEVHAAIESLREEYEMSDKALFVQNVAGGWRFATRKEYAHWVRELFSKEMTHRLSNAALETLAIIAYRQPITSQEVESIRGVSSSGVLRGLLEKKLIRISGRKEVIGRPILYRTTDEFLGYFGLDSLSDMPPLDELGIGQDPIEEIENGKDKGTDQPD